MMKFKFFQKKRMIGLGLFCFIGAVAVIMAGIRIHGPFSVVQVDAERLQLAASPAELEEVSDLIVIARIAAPGRNRYDYFPNTNDIAVGYTETQLIVEEVLGGTAQVGDRITITEECYTTGLGTKLWTQGGYLPAEMGKDYLFFLKAYQGKARYAGMYFPVDLEYGRYLLPDASGDPVLSVDGENENGIRSRLHIGPAADVEEYLYWYQSVMSMYGRA